LGEHDGKVSSIFWISVLLSDSWGNDGFQVVQGREKVRRDFYNDDLQEAMKSKIIFS